MSGNGSPGPGWTLGEDGHWKPPPFDVAATPSRPAPPPPVAPATGRAAADPGTPSTGPWAAGRPAAAPRPAADPWATTVPGPTPLPPGRSPLAVAGIVIGVVGALGVGLLVVLILAVALLGTSSESRVTPVGPGPVATAGGSASPAPMDRVAPPPSEPAPDGLGAEAVSLAIASDLVAPGGEGTSRWRVVEARPVPLDEGLDGCVPEGWMTGALDRWSTSFVLADPDGAGGTDDGASVRVTGYDSEAAAATDVERARSEEMAACTRADLETTHFAPGSVTLLPPDPLAPGSGEVRIVDHPDGDIVTYHFTVQLDRYRVAVSFCGCSELGFEGQQAVARRAAAAVAAVLDLPPLADDAPR